jgi:hypothetical protein
MQLNLFESKDRTRKRHTSLVDPRGGLGSKSVQPDVGFMKCRTSDFTIGAIETRTSSGENSLAHMNDLNCLRSGPDHVRILCLSGDEINSVFAAKEQIRSGDGI